MPKILSLPGLYVINKIDYDISPSTKEPIIILDVIDSYNKRKRQFRFDAVSIASKPENAKKVIMDFVLTGKINADAKLKYYPTPKAYNQVLLIASFINLRNQPCLVRYTYTGKHVGMVFYPHEVSF